MTAVSSPAQPKNIFRPWDEQNSNTASTTEEDMNDSEDNLKYLQQSANLTRTTTLTDLQSIKYYNDIGTSDDSDHERECVSCCSSTDATTSGSNNSSLSIKSTNEYEESSREVFTNKKPDENSPATTSPLTMKQLCDQSFLYNQMPQYHQSAYIHHQQLVSGMIPGGARTAISDLYYKAAIGAATAATTAATHPSASCIPPPPHSISSVTLESSKLPSSPFAVKNTPNFPLPPHQPALRSSLESIAASPLTTASYSMEPYAMNFMEQEYARIMAEEAHLKAINARKQRPKKFKCPHCSVAFSNNGQLKGHIRIHTGERPFRCDIETCGKTFTRNEELTRHKRIHTGIRPYPCGTCGKKFGRRDHLKKHLRTHLTIEQQLPATALFMPIYHPYMYGF